MKTDVIDVEYKEITPLEEKGNAELAVEANNLWEQVEAVSNIALGMAAQAGLRLKIVKNRLNHGEWEDWCKCNLKFSVRKARYMMELADRVEDSSSIFSNRQTLADIGISKVWALLGAPEEIAKEAVEHPQAAEMSVREFQEEIRRLKDEKKAAEEEQERTETEFRVLKETYLKQEREIEDKTLQLKEVEEQLKIYQDVPVESPEQEAEIERLKGELEKVRLNLGKEREKSQQLKGTLEKEKERILLEAKEQVLAEAKAKFDEEHRILIESNREAAAEIDRLQKNLQNSSQADIAEFKVKSDQLQHDFIACKGSITKVSQTDAERGKKMRQALKSVMENMLKQLEV